MDKAHILFKSNLQLNIDIIIKSHIIRNKTKTHKEAKQKHTKETKQKHTNFV